MKKFSIFLILLVSINIVLGSSYNWVRPSSTLPASIWTQNGTKIYYNTGYVGIGNTNPLEHLQVSGNAYITGYLGLNKVPSHTFPLELKSATTSGQSIKLIEGGTGSEGYYITMNTLGDLIFRDDDNTDVLKLQDTSHYAYFEGQIFTDEGLHANGRGYGYFGLESDNLGLDILKEDCDHSYEISLYEEHTVLINGVSEEPCTVVLPQCDKSADILYYIKNINDTNEITVVDSKSYPIDGEADISISPYESFRFHCLADRDDSEWFIVASYIP